MTGDDKRRFCESCDKHVHDLSAGTEEEARELLRANQGRRICVRFAKNENGSLRFRAAALVAAAISVSACGSQAMDQPVVDPSTIDHDQGDMIPDAIDRCPDVPTQESIEDGCPADADAGPSVK
ncbi:MAG: hypothetical protein ACREJX_16635 [Polyangiaceae bacterium]